MGALEIFLLIAGGIILILGFLLPQSKNKISDETKGLVREEIKILVSQEMDDIKSHVDDVVDEAVGYAVEKTERSLERLTNEKIMAVNEYSDTVLQEIHKNHEEVTEKNTVKAILDGVLLNSQTVAVWANFCFSVLSLVSSAISTL